MEVSMENLFFVYAWSRNSTSSSGLPMFLLLADKNTFLLKRHWDNKKNRFQRDLLEQSSAMKKTNSKKMAS